MHTVAYIHHIVSKEVLHFTNCSDVAVSGKKNPTIHQASRYPDAINKCD